ncbi:two-component sensor histidine kinase [Betaproteobacteria bacterium]|nr:two-component sensor histidine kinase [Betaproteobacteria bacterium]
MKRSPQPFARRIVLAFTLMTFVVSGVLSLCLVYVIHYIEQEILQRSMDNTLNRVLSQDFWQGQAPQLDIDTRFFAAGDAQYAIPPSLARAEEGFSEALGGDTSYWVYARTIGGRRYILVRDQREFETHEQTLVYLLFAGFLLTVAGAYAVGRVSAQKVMEPISRLAEQVRQHDPLQPATPLAQDYANDEIGSLAAAFDAALQNLDAALERERLFTGDASHELRTPLMIIATSCELLQAAQLPEHERSQIERIARATHEMQELTETFLMLARNNSHDAMPKTTCDLATVAAEQRSRWQPEIAAKGLAFELVDATHEPPPGARYHALLLRTVIDNLLRNALHYTEHGWVRLVLENDGFCVEDSGVGISEQSFAQGTRARGEGLGLGLSIVRRICGQQGWQITLTRLPAGGSRFQVKLR